MELVMTEIGESSGLTGVGKKQEVVMLEFSCWGVLSRERLLWDAGPSSCQYTAMGGFSFGFERNEIFIYEPPWENFVLNPRSAEYLIFGRSRIKLSTSSLGVV
ncbi:hypothetical protein KFK09_000551 [Dendrobium nobile]|uniref:Uncharacterized protein n=1 Tax=Dendrobium nobile TaxID=94219 RepID=A0A8T3CC75_DENNO|nr:hypothetical protein KFK09_000551 [Dendrobium nobile]